MGRLVGSGRDEIERLGERMGMEMGKILCERFGLMLSFGLCESLNYNLGFRLYE